MPRVPSGTRPGSGAHDLIPPQDPAPPQDRGVNADVTLVVLDRGPKDGRVLGQVPLAQGCHDAARAWLRDAELDLAPERKRPADPFVLHEPLGPIGDFDHEVGPEATDLEAALRGPGRGVARASPS